MRLVVSIDTEADGQWTHGAALTTRNVAFWQPFMGLCERHGALPTYLVTSEIVEDDTACECLRTWSSEGGAEVGAHLHPWTTPPFVDRPGLRRNDHAHAFPSELPDDLLRAKLITLTDQIEERIGLRPTSYRAGRFGFDARCARVLEELGYVVDSSVTPLVTWSDTVGLAGKPGGPDFRSQPATPFLIAGVGGQGLLELPVTVVQTSPWLRRNPWATGLYLSRPARVARRLRRRGRRLPAPMWLRPFPGVRGDDLASVWRAASDLGLGTLVMMFHSSELMPGGSPYRPTRRSVTALLALLDEFFAFAVSSGCTFATLTEAAHAELACDPPVRRL